MPLYIENKSDKGGKKPKAPQGRKPATHEDEARMFTAFVNYTIKGEEPELPVRVKW
ncbi:MAG: hypothetical protein ACLFOY_07755 [Desulfatibacillaceae bacterium]